MEKVLAYLEQCSRLKELERQLPELEQQLGESRQALREARLATAQAKWELDKAEKGGFFQRLMGNQEEKKEKAHREYRQAQASEQRGKQAAEEAANALEEANQEKAALDGSWEKFLVAKEAYLAEGGDPHALADTITPVLASQAVWEIGECLANLEGALPWMRADVRTTRVGEGNRKLEFLGNAREHAGIILALLEQLPEGRVNIPGYLRNPDGFILGVTMAYRQLDRMELAQNQLRELRNQLRKLQC